MAATSGRLALFSVGLVVGFFERAGLSSRGSLGRRKFAYRSCSSVPSFRRNNSTFHLSSNLEKLVMNASLYRLNQESKVCSERGSNGNPGAQSVPDAENDICTAYLKCTKRQHSGNSDALWTCHWQPASGAY
ncbi:hypothetical protein CSKR_111926 [Clonorchis sinensis]|uniref:Uncharacterized protein n=1 Tax=Clonorchis sinensis TaxID=79923 RepID=A0A419PQE5_CLOSI|nr:hypothetical protein CSKR_111926 [Clonorchis sinensis]